MSICNDALFVIAAVNKIIKFILALILIDGITMAQSKKMRALAKIIFVVELTMILTALFPIVFKFTIVQCVIDVLFIGLWIFVVKRSLDGKAASKKRFLIGMLLLMICEMVVINVWIHLNGY